MKHFFKSIAALTIVLLASSCIDFSDNIKKGKLDATDFKTVTINNEYAVKLPKYMKEAKDLNDEASLQYQNIFKETYFVVLDESKEEFKEVFIDIGEYNDSISLIKNYKEVQLAFFKESITDYEFVSEESLIINDMNAEVLAFNAKIPDVIYTIGYQFTYIEGKEKVYMLMAWSLKDKMKKYTDTFDYISNSFTIVE